jgi:hypothetical protein
LERLVTRARRAGVLRSDVNSVDIHRLIEIFSRRRPDDESGYHRLVEVALQGLQAPAKARLPGPPPGWDTYTRLWSSDRA